MYSWNSSASRRRLRSFSSAVHCGMVSLPRRHRDVRGSVHLGHCRFIRSATISRRSVVCTQCSFHASDFMAAHVLIVTSLQVCVFTQRRQPYHSAFCSRTSKRGASHWRCFYCAFDVLPLMHLILSQCMRSPPKGAFHHDTVDTTILLVRYRA